MSFLRLLSLLLGSLFLLSSCAPSLKSLPLDQKPSQAFQDYTSTLHGKTLEKETRKHPGKSGFSLIPYGEDAFKKRMRMIALAEKSLDLQYYIWSTDITGNLLANQIIIAADRGVKIRILLDDLGLKGRDKLLASMDAHPNIEIRIFNPFTARNSRGLNFLTDFKRLNHRMHNKVIVADNALAIIGGRNIGDHYFSVSKKGNFKDLDIICAGPVVRDISEVHDYFWNARWAVPVRRLAGNDYTSKHLQKAREKLARKASQHPFPSQVNLSRATMISKLTQLRSRMVWAHGVYVWNDPKELQQNKKNQKHTIIHQLDRKTSTIHQSLLVESPYFIPKSQGVSSLKSLVDRDVQVRILTNSMRSNDVLPSHAGYARYRKDLIQAGVELYELRPDAKEGKKKSKFSFAGSQNAGLHTKAFVFDQESIFVGSFNLDPRSSSINTEGGLYVESKQLTQDLINYMDADVHPRNSYHVTLDPKGKLLWTTEIDEKKILFRSEPQSCLWSNFLVRLMQMLPIENQL